MTPNPTRVAPRPRTPRPRRGLLHARPASALPRRALCLVSVAALMLAAPGSVLSAGPLGPLPTQGLASLEEALHEPLCQEAGTSLHGGCLVWSQATDGTDLSNGVVSVAGSVLSLDGSTLFTAGSFAPTHGGMKADMFAVAFDPATGSEAWSVRYNGPGSREDYARAVALSPDGATLYLAGDGWGGPTQFDITLVAVDLASRSIAWVGHHDRRGTDDRGYAIAVHPDGSLVYVGGRVGMPGNAGGQPRVVAFDARDGSVAWSGTRSLETYGSVLDLVVSPDGSRVYTAGHSGYTGTPDGRRSFQWAIASWDARSGQEMWRHHHITSVVGHDYARAITISPDGASLYVTGNSRDCTATDDGRGGVELAVFEAADGRFAWSRCHQGRWADSPVQEAIGGRGRDVQLSRDGSVVVTTGTVTSLYSCAPDASGLGCPLLALPDIAVAAYDTATGDALWEATYDHALTGNDEALDLALSPDGARAYITGFSEALRPCDTVVCKDRDIVTVAYDMADGAERWVARHHAGDDAGWSVLVAPDGGAVYTTGQAATDIVVQMRATSGVLDGL